MVASGTRNAWAISGVVMPARVRRVNATWASKVSAGWQQVNIRRSRSSGTSSSAVTLSSLSAAMTATSRVLDSPTRSRRARSTARLRATVVSHAPGRRGMPSRGQRSQRGREGILRTLLGEVPVAGEPHEGRDDPAPLGVERLGYCGLDIGRHISQIGLTSIEPSFAPGICAATSMASSRSLQSTRK